MKAVEGKNYLTCEEMVRDSISLKQGDGERQIRKNAFENQGEKSLWGVTSALGGRE